jgi:hypothetical protein
MLAENTVYYIRQDSVISVESASIAFSDEKVYAELNYRIAHLA